MKHALRLGRNSLIWAIVAIIAGALLGVDLTWQVIVLMVGMDVLGDVLNHYLPLRPEV